jgi:hypothetical protein
MCGSNDGHRASLELKQMNSDKYVTQSKLQGALDELKVQFGEATGNILRLIAHRVK